MLIIDFLTFDLGAIKKHSENLTLVPLKRYRVHLNWYYLEVVYIPICVIVFKCNKLSSDKRKDIKDKHGLNEVSTDNSGLISVIIMETDYW